MRPTATGPQEAMTGQAWNRKGQPNRAVLEHARALLLALAVLVDRAAGLPTARRLWFLAVMASGEAEVRRLIFAMAADRCPGIRAGFDVALSEPSAPPLRASHPRPFVPGTTVGEPTMAGRWPLTSAAVVVDVALLAARFRMLALAVEAMLAQVAAEPPCRHASPFLSLGRQPRRVAQFTPSPVPRATSPP